MISVLISFAVFALTVTAVHLFDDDIRKSKYGRQVVIVLFFGSTISLFVQLLISLFGGS